MTRYHYVSGTSRKLMSERHEHSWNQWEVQTIDRVQKLYNGTAGDKAFIVRKCATCPAKLYSDYGSKSAMEQKIWDLVGKLLSRDSASHVQSRSSHINLKVELPANVQSL